MNLLKRWLVFMLALFVAAWLIPGIQVVSDAWVVYAITAAILALLNAILLPILKTLSCGLIILTLGLFSLVLNAAMFMLSSYLAQTWFNAGYIVTDFLVCFAWLAHRKRCVNAFLLRQRRRKMTPIEVSTGNKYKNCPNGLVF